MTTRDRLEAIGWAVLLAAVIVGFILIAADISDAQEIRRPTAETSTSLPVCSGYTNQIVTQAYPNGWDAFGPSTSTANSAVGTIAGPDGTEGGGVITTWAAASGAYTSLNLIVEASCTKKGTGDGCGLQYSINGGSSYTAIATGSWAQTVFTVSVSPSTVLSNIVVRDCTFAHDGPNAPTNGLATLTIFDIRTEGVLGATPTKKRVRIITNGKLMIRKGDLPQWTGSRNSG